MNENFGDLSKEIFQMGLLGFKPANIPSITEPCRPKLAHFPRLYKPASLSITDPYRSKLKNFLTLFKSANNLSITDPCKSKLHILSLLITSWIFPEEIHLFTFIAHSITTVATVATRQLFSHVLFSVKKALWLWLFLFWEISSALVECGFSSFFPQTFVNLWKSRWLFRIFLNNLLTKFKVKTLDWNSRQN